jgi:hypothetical protein
MSAFGVTGPYFFQENNHTITVNSDHYHTILDTYLAEEL